MSAQSPTDATMLNISALRPIISVMMGQHQVLHADGDRVHVHVISFADYALVVAALAKALAAFTASQPELSRLAEALDAVEKLSVQVDSNVTKDGLTAIGEAITDLRDRINATTAARPLN